MIVSGDTLLPGMRLSIERFFQSKCFDHYGQCEGVAMAMECPNGQMHVIPAIGILEILREDGTPCVAGETGEMVATGLLNDAMPLIRYRLGDYAAWAETQNCECGNPQPIITNLEGRVDDYLVARDGRKIGRLSTAVKRSPTIHSAQIVQDEPGHAFLLVRPGEGYRSADAVAVRDDIQERIGAFSIEIVEVSEIPKTRQGKTSLVVRLADRPGTREIYEPSAQPRDERRRMVHAVLTTNPSSRTAEAPSKRRYRVLVFSVIALVFGTSVSLLLAEFAVRLFNPQTLTSDVVEWDPDVDYRLRPNARGRMVSPEFSAEIRVNSLGFRGPEISPVKKPGVRRVLFLGDSFMFGAGLKEHETLPYAVSRELERRHAGDFEAINGGRIRLPNRQ